MKLLPYTLLILSTSLPFYSLAASHIDTETNATLTSSPRAYWAAAVGMAQINHNENIDSRSAQSLKFEFGYDLNANFALYTSYNYINKFTSTKNGNDVNLHLLNLGLKYNYSVSPKLSLFGKLGGAYIYADNHHGKLVMSDNVTLALGAGLDYRLSPTVTTQFGFDYYPDIMLAGGQSSRLSQVYWGLTYHFGSTPHPTPLSQSKQTAVETELTRTQTTLPAVQTLVPYLLPFALGEDSLSQYSLYMLHKIADQMNKTPTLTASITGRADQSGGSSINQKISKNRANKVADYLVNHGIAASRLNTSFKSNREPLSSSPQVERSVAISLH